MTEGSISRKIIFFAIPLFIGNLFQQLYNTADSLIVGNFLGSNALAAVSSSGNLIFLMVGFINGIALGAGVVIARYYGAKNKEYLQKAIHTTVAFGLAAGLALTAIGMFLAPKILVLMGTPSVLPGPLELPAPEGLVEAIVRIPGEKTYSDFRVLGIKSRTKIPALPTHHVHHSAIVRLAVQRQDLRVVDPGMAPQDCRLRLGGNGTKGITSFCSHSVRLLDVHVSMGMSEDRRPTAVGRQGHL